MSTTQASARVRLRLARLLGGTTGLPGGAVRVTTPPVEVPLTVRALTCDGEEVRLLLEAWMQPAGSPMAVPPERLAYTVIGPAVSRWVADRRLDDLGAALGDDAVDDGIRAVLTELGADLLRVDVVAIEHLVISPSADPDRSAHGSC